MIDHRTKRGRFLKPRFRHWDEHFASPTERELAMAANRMAGWPEWVDTTTEPATQSGVRGAV